MTDPTTTYTAVSDSPDGLYYHQGLLGDTTEAYLDMQRPIPDGLFPGEEVVRRGVVERNSLSDIVEDELND